MGSISVFGDDQQAIDIRSVAFFLRLQISRCLLPSSIVPFPPRMHKAVFTLDHSPSILNEDDAPTGTITDPTSYYLHLSPTSSESIDHLTGSSQSSLPKPFQAFFATRSRVLKVSGVCGITSLTLLTLNIQLYNLPAMAESLLYQLFHPHNVPLLVILPRLYQIDIILHTGF